MVEYNPDRIVLMRRLEKKTQAELTEGTGISTAKISKIQNRIVPFTKEDAEKIATCVDYPLSFFSMDDTPTPPTELTYRRSQKPSSVKSTQSPPNMRSWQARYAA